MFQRIDVRIVPQIAEADYDAFRTLIKLLPRDYGLWRSYHEMALTKRGADAVVQVVTIGQFGDHIRRHNPNRATLADLLRCATGLASREV